MVERIERVSQRREFRLLASRIEAEPAANRIPGHISLDADDGRPKLADVHRLDARAGAKACIGVGGRRLAGCRIRRLERRAQLENVLCADRSRAGGQRIAPTEGLEAVTNALRIDSRT